jgi:hypothetical protein
MINASARRALVLGAALAGLAALTHAQSVSGGFEGFWGSKFSPLSAPERQLRGDGASTATAIAAQQLQSLGAPTDARSRLVYWNHIAIDASGVDHTPVQPGENRVFGEQLGPGRASLAIAIVQVAVYDAVNAMAQKWESYSDMLPAPTGASLDAAIDQAAHDTLVVMFPSQARTFDDALTEDLARIGPQGKLPGRMVGQRAATAVLASRQGDGSDYVEPILGEGFTPSLDPGKWRQDPISQLPVALGALWGAVRPLVIQSGKQFRVPPPPAMTSAEYTAAYNEAKRLGGDGVTTPTERTEEQSSIGIYWAYDGTPSLCAPPRMYNQIVMTIADQKGSDVYDLARLLALANVAMADTAIAVWESKFYYQFWRPVTAIRESDPGTGPTGLGDGNSATIGDPTFTPFGSPASNLNGPNFTPPFPTYPSGHGGFGGAVFEVLRQFYGTDAIPFTFVSDEYNGTTVGSDGLIRPYHPRSFATLSQAEEENGQSRIYLGIHWAFDKTRAIEQGRTIAQYIVAHAFRPAP